MPFVGASRHDQDIRRSDCWWWHCRRCMCPGFFPARACASHWWNPGRLAAGATAAAMGHIVVLDDSPAQLALTRYSQLLWRQMASQLPPDAEYTQRGTLWVAADDEEMQEICRKHSVYNQNGIPSEVISRRSHSRRIEPALRRGLAGGLLVRRGRSRLSSAGRPISAPAGACRRGHSGSRNGSFHGIRQSPPQVTGTNCTRPFSSTRRVRGLPR